MAKCIPGIATFGLLCMILLPAPGIWGLLIGGSCALAIIVVGLMWLLDRIAARVAALLDRRRGSARRRRGIHAGSGIAMKAKVSGDPAADAATPLPAAEPARPSIVQERARARALRREAGRLEPFRLR